MKDIVNDVPWINNTSDLAVLLKEEYILSDYFFEKKRYEYLRDQILAILRGCYQIRECREYDVAFRFYPRSETHHMQLRHFLISLILWGPITLIFQHEDVLTDDLLFDMNGISDFVNSFVNGKMIPLLKDYMVSPVEINGAIADLCWYIGNRLSMDFATLINVNYTMVDFFNFYNNDPDIKKAMDLTLDESKQPSENEIIISDSTDLFIRKIKAMNDNGLSLILNSGYGIKPKQLGEYSINQGYRPTLTGETIGIPINSSIIKGAQRPSDLYISGTGARKSQVTNKKVMGKLICPVYIVIIYTSTPLIAGKFSL